MKSRFARAAQFLALALLLAGCSKKITQPDASFTTLEGSPGVDFMLGWSDQAVSAAVYGDPGTPDDPTDDVLLQSETFFFADTAGARFQIWDVTGANGYELFRTAANGALTRVFDYDVRPTRKYIFAKTDIFEFEDPAPLSATSAYVARGTFNGVTGTNSPLTNRVLPLGHIDDGLQVTINKVVRDSVLRLRWTPDPRAIFYVLEFLDAGTFTTRRSMALRSTLPSPIMSDSRVPDFPLLVGASGTPLLVLPFYPAIFPVHLFVRISAYDANGRMVSRNDEDKASFSQEIPPSSPYRRIYELMPIGGALITLDPYNQGGAPPTSGSLALSRLPGSPVANARPFRLRDEFQWLDAPVPPPWKTSSSRVVATSFGRIRQLFPSR